MTEEMKPKFDFVGFELYLEGKMKPDIQVNQLVAWPDEYSPSYEAEVGFLG